MKAYQSVSVDRGDECDHADDGPNDGGDPPLWRKGLPSLGGIPFRPLGGPACLALGGAALLSVLSVLSFAAYGRARPRAPPPPPPPASSPPPPSRGDVVVDGVVVVDVRAREDVPPDLLPGGVNLASWLSLEDWFFVGSDGAVEVASPDDSRAASCLPPLHLDSSTGPRWNSETDLLAGLAEHYSGETGGGARDNATGGGGSPGGWGKAVGAVHAYRASYYDLDAELRTMAELGIRHVRVPVSWCWTDHDPARDLSHVDGATGEATYIPDDDVRRKFACQDPFYEGVFWPAIPRGFFRRFLRKCAEYGIGATIDLHTYPGGTSIGTFSGVWPRHSRFWTHGDAPSTDGGRRPDVGRTLLGDFIGWMESLETSDPLAFKG
jgi:hypothetical protein